MDFRELSRLVGELPFGKRVRHEHYIHAECLPFCGEELGELVETLRREAAVSSAHNVIKFNLVNPKISFLWYPEFHQQPHPELRSSVTVDLESGKVTRHDYGNSENPPILHRKETLLPAGRAEISVYEDLTRAEEARGLYRSNKTIGFKKNWERLLAEKGLGYAGHQLIVVEAPGGAREEDARVKVCRHKTAIARYRFSRPIQTVLENGLLTPDTSLLDFGCGQADDVKGLKEMGFSVSGWDPVHRPEGPKEVADVVNLGFVLNVIEDPVERTEVLNEAYELSRKLLVVSTLIATSETGKLGRPYKDGILTSRNTFQKYFRQDELEGYIEDVLHTSALAAGLGIFYVFRSPSEQQAFLARRSKRSVNWQDPKWRIRPPREPGLRVRRTDVYQRHPELLDAFWAKMLELGRVPGADEFDRYDQILREIGSARRAKNLLLQKYGEQALAEAFEFRRNDLQVYLALSNFRGRIPFRHLPAGLQQDIKVFLGGNRLALEASQALLFSAGNPEVITRLADNTPFGFLDHQALFIHRSLIQDLDPVLRIYVGCAEMLYGDLTDIDIIKIHKRSGKVTLLKVDDFEGKPLPELHERIKVDLRRQRIDVFDHRSSERQELLYCKERYVGQDHPERARWQAFSNRLASLGLDLDRDHGPTKQELAAFLGSRGESIDFG